ncbi:ABCC1 [Mytilus edulis]|uniref:ABC-type glutathione-S-conjugate transporter n=1 Tax=Mytilus edulis TaxID=6550 RepID=A0A8S3UQC0_MYTED|nr:ABCC1 [Mytilus edulis]
MEDSIYCDRSFLVGLRALQENINTTHTELTENLQKTTCQWNTLAILLMGVPLCFFQITSRTKDQKCSKRLVNFRIILTGLIALLTTCYLMKNIQDMFGENGAVIGTFTSVIVEIEMKYVTNGTMNCILFALYVLLVLTILTQTYLHRSTTKEQKSKLEEESTSVSSESLFSKLTFGYCTKLVIKGYRQKLDKKDLFPLNEEETSACVVPRFEKYWNQEVDYIKRSCVVSTTKKAGKGNEELKQQPRLVKCLLTAFGPYVLGAAMLNLLSSIFGLLTPFVLRLLIQFTEDHTNAMWKGYMYAILMFGLTIGKTIFETQQGLRNCSGERRMWIAISSVIYKKTLRLSNSAKKSSTSGEIVNLLSVDAGRISTCFHNINFLWTIPFMFCATLFLLWQTLGLEVMDLKDNRVKMMNEVLNGIKVLKLYAWEDSFEKQISTIRDKEMGVIRNQALVGTCMHLAWCLTPFLANVALKRIQAFLNKEELNEEAVTRNHDNKNAVTVDSGTFAWNKEDDFMLKDINVHIPEGSFVAIVGSVGSGKSSMLSAILGEMESMSGKVNLKGTVAYVSQQAWIRNASLQNNILFGKGMDKSEYNDIINATALRTDLDMLSGGDQTEIGEKGINLSGGQKQRVSLARALYQDADIYLLDDPLSAVDAHVGKHIFDEVLDKKGKLGKKTRILVTNGVSFLPKTDMIITMVDGKIGEMGTFKELIDHKGAFAEFLDNYMINKGSDKEETLPERDETSGLSQTKDENSNIVKTKDENSKTVKTTNDINETDYKTVDKIIDDESNESGKARSAVMSFYMSAIGVPLSVFIVIFNIAFEILSRSSDVWISQWTSDNTTHINGTVDTTQRNMRLGVYAGIGVLQGFVLLLVGYGVSTARMNASRKLHKNLLRNILRSPMTFFDTTPVGRIVNRFSNDVARIDNEIIYQFKDCIISAAVVICNSVIICFGTPQFLCVLLPITILYFILQRFYTVTSTQLRRFETSANSPIYSQFAETISGTSTIRAYNQQGRFIDESAERIDAHKTAQNSAGVVSRWLSIRLQFMGALILLFVCIFAVLEKATLSAGIVGLVITYALEITGCLQWVVRVISDLENNTVSIEKIQEYTETPTEAAWEIPEKQPSSSWPKIGCIEFQDYGVRYREGLDLVLRGITCTIQPNEKIGIVGRTGAGKSSLTMALFRILEKAKGKIIIDGIDISTIGLHDLRSKITIIPQDPVLFSGTMRMNLDPFEEYSNEEIWKALKHAHLKKFVDGLDEGLEHKCSEGGENFSVGQRQLMCLARALLRKTKILVLDEATAAVDLETDDLIQKTIRTEFSDCTILTIAHRLNTIMDYTRIMVLDAGNISEFDTPSNLLDNCDSVTGEYKYDAYRTDREFTKDDMPMEHILTGLIALLTTCYLMKNIQDMFGENGAVIGTFTSVIVEIEMKYITNGTMNCILFALYVLLVLTILTQTYLHRSTTKEQKSKLEEESTSVSSESLFSKLTFGYCTKLVMKGYRQKLDKKDLFPLNEEETSACVVPRFEKYWNQEVEYIKRSCVVSTTKKAGKGNEELKQQPRLVKCLLTAFGPYVLGAAMLNLLSSIFGLLTPFVLRLLIQFTEDHTNAMWKGYMYAILMFGLTIGKTIFETQQGLRNCSGERRMWIAISSVIYKKTLRLSNSAKKSSTSGEIVNLLSVDAGRISTCFHNINFLWTIPFMFCSTLFLLWQTLGVSAFIGLGIVVVLIPFNSYLVKKGKDLHLEVMDLKDNRVKMMNEVLNGIKVLKLYAWEDSFEKQISTIRDKEMGVIRNQALVGTCMHLAWCLTPFLVSLGTFAMYVLIDPENVLTAEKAFVAMSLFGMLSWNLNALPHIVNHYVQANVALKRIQTFLNEEELNEEAVTRNHDNKNAVTVDSGTFAWNKEDDFMLKDINVHIPEGSFVAIVGSVGSGKSSMLSAILGEMESMSGKVNLKGSVAYVSQQAWIRNASLQNNILFGKGMDKSEYNDIINATALRTDLDMLSGGDQTEIGEKGINLSGGQKQRVSLARALYQDADIYLLDDPLSAVDAHVGKHIFDEVLDKKGKLGKKTRILVTNGVSFLPKTDMIITMVDGKIGEMGTFKKLIDHKGAFAEFLDNYMINKGSDKEEKLSKRDETSGVSQTKDENSNTVKTKDDIEETDNKTVDKIIDEESQ